MSFAARLRAVPILGSAAFSTVGKRGFPRADLAVQRAAGGRFSLSGDDLLVIGSNRGQRRHPAWALNPRAEPSATPRSRDCCGYGRTFATYTKRAEQRELLVLRLTGPTER